MKTSRACTGMMSPENDDFKFLKDSKKHKKHVHHVHHSSKACGTVLSLQRLSVVDQKYERKSSHIYIFQNIEI